MFIAEFDRARVRRHKSKGPFGLVSGFPIIEAIIIVIAGTQQAEKIPIAMASVQETRTSMREVSFTETFRALLTQKNLF